MPMQSYSLLKSDGQAAPADTADISTAIEALFAPEIGVENEQCCYYSLSRQVSTQTLVPQGFEASETASESRSPYILLGYREASGFQCVDTGTTALSKDDVRENDIRRKGTRSTYLAKADWEKGEAAWKHARRLLRTLNQFLTINDPVIRDAKPEDRPALWRPHTQRIRVFFQNNREPLTWVWCRSTVDKHGNGEHLHVLLHVPVKLQRKFSALVDRYWPQPLGKLQPVVKDGTYPVSGGRHQSIFNYVFQGLNKVAAQSLGVKWVKGGAVFGQRFGWSSDISPEAVAAWEVRNGITTR